MSEDVPKTHEDLTAAIHARYDGLSRSYQQIARYITQNPNDVALHSVNLIAQKCGVHASSLIVDGGTTLSGPRR